MTIFKPPKRSIVHEMLSSSTCCLPLFAIADIIFVFRKLFPLKVSIHQGKVEKKTVVTKRSKKFNLEDSDPRDQIFAV